MFADDLSYDLSFSEWDSYNDYEQFRDDTGHITNFDKKDKQLYQAAIDKYKVIKPDANLFIGDSYEASDCFGLYCGDAGDLSEFWRIYDELRESK